MRKWTSARKRVVFGRMGFVLLVPFIMLILCREASPERLTVAGQLVTAMAINVGALAFEPFRGRWWRLAPTVDMLAGIGMGLAILAVIIWNSSL